MELREAVASFLDDRRRLTDQQVARLGIQFSPTNDMHDSLDDQYFSDGSEGDEGESEGMV